MQNLGETRKRKLADEHFKMALDKGVRLIHHYSTTQSSHDIIHHIVKYNLATFRNESSSAKTRIPMIRQLVIDHPLENRDGETNWRKRLPSLEA